MRCEQIIRCMEADIPRDCAESWDNVGLLCGDPQRDVKKILVALDASDAAIQQAKESGADMLITHHPLIFSPMKRVTADDFIGRRIIEMIRNDISCYAMHTNYDILRMADLAAERLGLTGQQPLAAVPAACGAEGVRGFGKIGNLQQPMKLEAFAQQIRELFGLPGILVYGDAKREIMRAAMCPGSGKSFLDEAVASGAQVYVTGDVDYHFGIDANARGIAVIDAGHYGLEHIFTEDMKQYLTNVLYGEVIVESVPTVHPYMVV